MEKQTALRQVVEKLDKLARHIPPRSNTTIGLAMAMNVIKEYMEVEKTQIVDAFNDGCGYQHKIGDEYFNQTYKK